MLLGGAILPPAETLVVEDELLLLPREALPLLPAEDGLTASEEVPVPPLLFGAVPCGAKVLSFGGSIFFPKRKDFAAFTAETLLVEDELLLLLEEATLLLVEDELLLLLPEEAPPLLVEDELLLLPEEAPPLLVGA